MGVRVSPGAPQGLTMSEENDNNLEPFARRRIEICRQCEHYVMFVCKQCGCFMPAKTRFRGTSCPIGKWAAETDGTNT